jgi:hypothetical protein
MNIITETNASRLLWSIWNVRDGCHTIHTPEQSSGEHSIIYANLFQGKQACTRIQSSSREAMNKTAVFSGQMNQIVFSPY